MLRFARSAAIFVPFVPSWLNLLSPDHFTPARLTQRNCRDTVRREIKQTF